jgi:F0F1-type ATP synthase delta subunit
MYENGDFKKAEEIVIGIEKTFLAREGRNKISITSALPLSSEIIENIRKKFNKNDVIETKIDPEILAGIKIMINGNKIIDASLRKKLNILFTSQ